MIAENPLGFGAGGFEHNYLLYDNGPGGHDPESTTQMTVRSPHNGFLELFVENGSPFAIAFLAAMFFIFVIRLGRQPMMTDNPIQNSFLGLTIYVWLEACFSFPLELPFTFLSLGVYTGLCLPKAHSRIKRGLSLTVLLTLFLFFSSLHTGLHGFFNSSKNGANSYRVFAGNWLCRAFPGSSFYCSYSAAGAMNNGNSAQGLATLNGHLERSPNDYQALSLRLHNSIQTEDFSAACNDIHRILKLFPRDNIHRMLWIEKCSKLGTPRNDLTW